jgi:hypothetical protein
MVKVNQEERNRYKTTMSMEVKETITDGSNYVVKRYKVVSRIVGISVFSKGSSSHLV